MTAPRIATDHGRHFPPVSGEIGADLVLTGSTADHHDPSRFTNA
ncbi:hypothetical protein [Saccharopolyspora rosea]|uniref:Uncharacterized protein n=1 Tax=Saccharopolyspora rosea TaxID=524884 RepID=A0ABW3FQS6_9PSEU|nr:hypothetical protein [Saccharopolyspora rosea]